MYIATKQTEVYQFNELDDSAKEKARDWWRNCETFEFESEYIIDDCKEIGAILGIDIDKIYYSGFSSQGDGACFEGSYTYKKGAHKAIRDYAPNDKELHDIADNLLDIQKRNFYRLSAGVTHSGHYYHAYCTNVSVYNDGEYADTETDEAITEYLRDFMNWIYSRLESAYDYTMSDENVDENIMINEYEFTVDGEIYYQQFMTINGLVVIGGWNVPGNYR